MPKKGSVKGDPGKAFREYPEPPAPSQNISLTGSRTYKNYQVPKERMRPRTIAMLDDLKRYTEAGSGKSRETGLCMNVIPLEENDPYPARLALMLDFNCIPDPPGKPCPSSRTKKSSYCQRCGRLPWEEKIMYRKSPLEGRKT